MSDDAKIEAEIKRLATPDPFPGPFGRYLWKHNWWGLWNPPYALLAILLAMIFTVPFLFWFGTAMFVVCMSLNFYSFTLYRKRVQWWREDVAWVEKMATHGPKPWGYDIAWTMKHLIDSDKVHVAAHLALGLLKQDYPDRFPPPEPDCG